MHHFLAGASNEPNINNDNKPLKTLKQAPCNKDAGFASVVTSLK